ncbi:kinase-like domain-containing protein [Amanita rubescens]|nr:kinase-like domain-containing protein [Amanita rubescens]
MISMGGYGRIFRGEHKGQQVALKVVDQGVHDDSLTKDFCREAITWRSLSHRFILPLLGIFEENSQLILVSPFMENGTLTRWRSKQKRDVVEIRRLMLEVAEGIQYLHSGGIVHGDLHGGNILLDSEFHCQITDFGTIQHFESTVTQPTTVFLNFAAPELFGTCTACGLPECHHGAQNRSKTMETDIFAFGGICYSTFFDDIPFHDKNYFQIVRLVMDGMRPDRPPGMEDDTWNLIQCCWEPVPSKRPTIEQIVKALIPPT